MMPIARCIALAFISFVITIPALAATTDWRADWQRTVAAAKQEGELVIAGPSGRSWRDFLTEHFHKSYPEIALKLTPSAGRDFWPRLIKEREIGQFLWDMRVGGSDNNTHVLKAQGMFEPIRDWLVLPEVLNDANWYGGVDGLFLDNDKRYLIGFALYESTIAHYNKAVVPETITLADVVKPQWTGKISMADPRGGASLNAAATLLKVYGEDYLRKLMTDQEPVITKNPRQQIQWLATGRYPIAFGLPTASLVEYAAHGGAVDGFIKIEGAHTWTQGVGGMSLITKAPHPNAAKVFINWILTRGVQTALMQAVKLNSRRKDVPLGDPAIAVDTARLSEYVGSQHEEMEYYHKRASSLLRDIMR
jgi:iron(III) transport system substrate-binding protein